MHGNATVSSWVGGRPGLPVVASWGQAVQYLDEKKVDQVCSIPPELPQKRAINFLFQPCTCSVLHLICLRFCHVTCVSVPSLYTQPLDLQDRVKQR